MPGAGERAYVYAKACGIIGKSFVGKRIPALGGLNRLFGLDRLVFPLSGKELPERELLPDLEKRITGRAIKQILAIVGSFSSPPELLVRLVRVYEYSDLKSGLNALVNGDADLPPLMDIRPFGTVNFKAFPDLGVMLRGTEFEFLLKNKDLKPGGDAVGAQTELDRLYYTSLWKALRALPKKDRISAERILAQEISLRNSIWVLRLRTYYGMNAEEAEKHLMDIMVKKGRGPEFSLAADARLSLSLPLDTRSAWAGWKQEHFLNPETGGRSWQADPRYFQNAASEHLYRLALHSFRRSPFSLDAAFCFIKLKQFEEDLLTSIAEGLGLGMSSQDVLALLEVKP
ncbi:hypothetical protein AGMMS50268_05110 [Spirochaetia bacterium]|nr:hypothetical protein AGMMS50268_05110 [Spirochaetia bacterium]